jgi:hypothetical protein
MAKNPAHEPAECTICKRAAVGLGVGDARDPRWLCAECVLLAGDIREVRRLNVYEIAAIHEAGDVGGQYLETLNQFDLSELQPAQYQEFCKRVILGFGDSIRKQIRSGRAPF